MKRSSNFAKYKKSTLKIAPPAAFPANATAGNSDQAGFSLIEIVCAMVVFFVAVLGVFVAFTFAINYNAGNSSRAEALAVLQQQVEKMRSAEWTLTTTDPKMTGGVKTPQPVNLPNGNRFIVEIVVDDDPSKNDVLVDSTTKLKEISVTVKLDRPTPGWQTSVPATVVLRRVRGN